MNKYARAIARHENNADDVHMVDIVDTSVYEPRPAWGQADEDLLSKIFAPNKDAWTAAGQWFVQVPDGVQNGASFAIGGDHMDPAAYVNPDGTDGNGTLPTQTIDVT